MNGRFDEVHTDVATTLADHSFQTGGDRADRVSVFALDYASPICQPKPPYPDPYKVNHEWPTP